MRDHLIALLAATGAALVCGFTFYFCFYVVGFKVSYELKWRYLQAVLRQDNEWFDKQDVESLPTNFHSNITIVEAATGKTVGFIFYSLSSCITGITITFICGAVFATTILVVTVYVFALGGFQGAILDEHETQDERAYSRGGGDAEQALRAVKVVKAFGMEEHENKKFESHLEERKKYTKDHAFRYGISFGLIETITYWCQSYAFLIGGFFIADQVNFY